ncbi:MAG: hypothetical protein JXR52_01610 [Bacteroidales bacterium]|nr:hypothetical protein [Bacteroidales bacterium]
MKKSLFFILILLIYASCETVDNLPSGGQPVYFEYEYINFAWGYQFNGWIIDSEGNVRYYEFPEDWKSADRTGFIGQADLAYNISLADSVIKTIGSTELMNHVALIEGAKDGHISERVNTACDAGTASLYCYWYHSTEAACKKIFLAASGDFTWKNESEEAEELVRWLKKFGVFWL